MKCQITILPDGSYAIVSREPRSQQCTICKRSIKEWNLCDFVIGTVTCNAVLCQPCASHNGPDSHYCPKHAAMMPAIPAPEKLERESRICRACEKAKAMPGFSRCDECEAKYHQTA